MILCRGRHPENMVSKHSICTSSFSASTSIPYVLVVLVLVLVVSLFNYPQLISNVLPTEIGGRGGMLVVTVVVLEEVVVVLVLAVI